MTTVATRPFAELLRSARGHARLTQQQLAARAGISPRAVSDLERGINHIPRQATLARLADALDLSAADRRIWASACEPPDRVDRYSPTATTPRRPLPVAATSFIGRETDLATAIDVLAQPNTRLLTLTGPGGVGKTRLAIAIAQAVEADFPGGVSFVNLAPLADADLVVPTIAQMLGVHASGAQSLQDAIATWLRQRTVLLLIDNVEHVIGSAPAIADLLGASPGVTMLATSRAPLKLHAEREFQVSPLALSTDAADAGQSSAVQLFVDRAQAVRSDFWLTRENTPSVVALCNRLDGLPLAIELAAARIKVLSPRELLERLPASLPLLTGGPRDVPARQQTLFDTIAWSYDLLAEPEQRLFRQLTIFAGGWTLDAAEAVCDADLDVLDGMTTLIDHNLIRQLVRRRDESRYSMLETIHEFGRQRRAEHDECEVVAGRHLSYVAASIGHMNAGLDGHEQEIWIERLLPEIDNVRRALAFALERNDGLAAINLAVASEMIWFSRYLMREAVDWLSRSLAIADDLPVAIVANAYSKLGHYAWEAYDYARAEQAYERAIDLHGRSGNQLGIARATHGLAWSAIYEGRYQRARDLDEQAFEIAWDIGDRALIATADETLAFLMTLTGEYDAAIARCQRSVDLYRADGDHLGACHALVFLGTIALWHGELDRAERCGKEALAAAPEGWDDSAAMATQLLGYVELDRANYRAAGTLIRQSLALRDPNQTGMPVAECFEGLAGVAAGLNDPARGATLLGAAEATRERFRTPIPPPRQGRVDRTLAMITAQMHPEALDVARKLGRSLSGDDAASYALEPDTLRSSQETVRHARTLSKREVEVLRLLTEGQPDREIAESLFISHHTVARHVSNILNKLGVSSRTAAATRAVRDNLV
jgi:predicted ATPase/DNA-binding CsgD family transcriptional regulator